MITLDYIIRDNIAGSEISLSENVHPSISLPSSRFFVPCTFNIICENEGSRFIIISAPGASGKTALAMYIAEKLKGIYWNLADIQIGENTFHGTLWKAMRQENLLKYWNDLKSGKSVLALDAFDEAELISGQSGIDFFLNDVEEITRGGFFGTIFLFSRTETAKYLEEYCQKASVTYSMYEIRFFEIGMAKNFVKEKLRYNGVRVTQSISNLIDMQFDVIMTALEQTDNPESFLGYAPVLEALAAITQSEKNTNLLLQRIKSSGSASIDIIYSILTDLLNREHKKFVKALQEKWKDRKLDFSHWDQLFTPTEQLVRLLEKTLFEETQENSLYDLSDLFVDNMYFEYNKMAASFIPQHPFIQNLARIEGLDFAGPAFRDYTYASVLNSEYDDIVKEILCGNMGRLYSPSQLLYDFYLRLSNGRISSDIFQIIYDSFKGKEGIHTEARINIFCGGEESYARFQILDKSSERVIEEKEMEFAGGCSQLRLERISDSVVNMDGTLQLGTIGRTVRIQNSVIMAGKIVINANKVMLNAVNGGKCILVSEDAVTCGSFGMQTYEIRTDSPTSLQVSFPNISSFSRLKKYSFENDTGVGKEFFAFYVFLQKLLGVVQKHKRKTESKDRGYIDNMMIGKNKFRRDVMDYLIKKGIIMKRNDARWYELNAEKLAEFGLSQVMISQQEENIRDLYKDYLNKKQ